MIIALILVIVSFIYLTQPTRDDITEKDKKLIADIIELLKIEKQWYYEGEMNIHHWITDRTKITVNESGTIKIDNGKYILPNYRRDEVGRIARKIMANNRSERFEWIIGRLKLNKEMRKSK